MKLFEFLCTYYTFFIFVRAYIVFKNLNRIGELA